MPKKITSSVAYEELRDTGHYAMEVVASVGDSSGAQLLYYPGPDQVLVLEVWENEWEFTAYAFNSIEAEGSELK